MLEEVYITQIAGQLRNFKKTNVHRYAFSCPICGDSRKVTSKARGNLFMYKGEWVYHCFNCDASHKFGTFLKMTFPEYYDDYIYDNFGYSKKRKVETLNIKTEKPVFNRSKSTDLMLSGNSTQVIALPKDHIAHKYILDRKIPEHLHHTLYYTENFKKFINDWVIPDKFENDSKPDARLIIPFYDKSNGLELIGLQGRALYDTRVKYITIKLIDEDEELLYGKDRVDPTKDVYLVEGPIDAMFIENGVAFAGSSLHTVKGLDNPVLVWDNEPRNKEIHKLQRKAIRAGFRVVIWSKFNAYKDINDMILEGMTIDADYLSRNTYQGVEAELVFEKWSK